MRRHDRYPSRTLPPLRVVKRFNAAPARVFDAWLDPGIARQWLFATASRPIARIEIDARVGGAFRFRDVWDGGSVDYAGRYLEIVPARRWVFTLRLPECDRAVTHVTVEIDAPRLETTLALVHEGVPRSLSALVEGRWTGMFYGLGLLLASNRNRPQLFGDRRCRFQMPPIDYTMEPPASHDLQGANR